MAGQFFLQNFNPMDLVKGYEFGQKSQREEDQALQDIESRRLLNELSRTKVGEFQSPQFTETRRLLDQYAQEQAGLGATLTGYEKTIAEQEREPILAGLRARTQSGSLAAQQGLAERQLRGELQPQEFDLARGGVKLRAAQQQESMGKVEESLRQIGAGEPWRQTFKDLPEETPTHERLAYAFKIARPEHRAAIYQQIIQQNKADLAEVNSPAAIDQWYRRPGNPFRSRAIVDGNQVVVYPILGRDEQGNDILPPKDSPLAQRFSDIVTWRASVNAAIPGVGGAARGTAAAKPQPGALGSSLAASITGAGAPAARPAATGAAPAVTAPAAPAAPQGAVFSESVSVSQPTAAQATASPTPTSTQGAQQKAAEQPPSIQSAIDIVRQAAVNPVDADDPGMMQASTEAWALVRALSQAQEAGVQLGSDEIRALMRKAAEVAFPFQQAREAQKRAEMEKAMKEYQNAQREASDVLRNLIQPSATSPAPKGNNPSGSSTIGIRG
jgi:hypothetical protein